MTVENVDQTRLIRLLATHAYREGEFVLASGQTTSFYLDAKQVTYRPEGAVLVGRAVLEAIRPFEVDAVGGMTLGADAIVASTVIASASEVRPLNGFIVRKEAKEHGLGRSIEGISPAGARVAIVEDVITTGGSALRAVECAREVGAEVAVVVGLVDRQQGGAEAFAEAGIPLRSICTLREIREALATAG